MGVVRKAGGFEAPSARNLDRRRGEGVRRGAIERGSQGACCLGQKCR